MPGIVLGTFYLLIHFTLTDSILSSSILQLEIEAQVAGYMSGRAGLPHSGKFGSRFPVSELCTGIAPGLLVFCMELTHFWQAAQDLQSLGILG